MTYIWQVLITGMCLIITVLAQGQAFYNDSIIEISAFYNSIDSSVFISVKNLSNKELILNDNGLKYVKIEREYVVDHSLISNGVSILQPGSQTKMLFKTLNPNLKCVFLAEKENGFIEENSVLNMRIQYIMVPLGFTFVDGISNLDMNDIIESKNLDLFTYEGVVKAVSLENCSGILVFKRL